MKSRLYRTKPWTTPVAVLAVRYCSEEEDNTGDEQYLEPHIYLFEWINYNHVLGKSSEWFLNWGQRHEGCSLPICFTPLLAILTGFNPV
jgi:hypothetical protein